jgi:hypothetical protein
MGRKKIDEKGEERKKKRRKNKNTRRYQPGRQIDGSN